jgi:hypothetical protein
MQKISTNKLDSVEGDELLLVAIAGVSPAEGDTAFSEVDDSAIGDGDSMGIPGKIVDHVLGPIHRWFRINDPLDLFQPQREAIKQAWRRKGFQVAAESELGAGESVSEQMKKLPPEHLRKHLHREEVLKPAT